MDVDVNAHSVRRDSNDSFVVYNPATTTTKPRKRKNTGACVHQVASIMRLLKFINELLTLLTRFDHISSTHLVQHLHVCKFIN